VHEVLFGGEPVPVEPVLGGGVEVELLQLVARVPDPDAGRAFGHLRLHHLLPAADGTSGRVALVLAHVVHPQVDLVRVVDLECGEVGGADGVARADVDRALVRRCGGRRRGDQCGGGEGGNAEEEGSS
jgi:hypothetical protein